MMYSSKSSEKILNWGIFFFHNINVIYHQVQLRIPLTCSIQLNIGKKDKTAPLLNQVRPLLSFPHMQRNGETQAPITLPVKVTILHTNTEVDQANFHPL